MLETIFGSGLRATVKVMGLKVELRTLLVREVADLTERTEAIVDPIRRSQEQQLLTVASSLISVDENPLPDGFEDRVKLIRSWPRAVAEKLMVAYTELYNKELQRLDELKN